MLTAEAEKRLGDSRFRTSLVLERLFRVHVAQRDRLVYDSRFAPAGPSTEGWAHLLVTMRGWFEVAAQRHHQPVAYLLSSGEYDGTAGVDHGYRSWGISGLLIEMALPCTAVAHPIGIGHGPIRLAAPAWTALAALVEAFDARRAVEPAVAELVRRLRDERLASDAMVASMRLEELAGIERIWAAARPRYAAMATSTTLKEMADEAGISVPQAARDIKALIDTFEYLGTGYRDIARVTRLRVAALLLTAPGVSASEVSQVVGYGSVDAMGRAFREAGLPAASVIQDELGFAVICAAT